MRRFRVAILTILICSASIAQAQPPWTFVSNNDSMLVSISEAFYGNLSDTTLRTELEQGSYIGVFYNSQGDLTCLGYSQYNSGADIIVYRDSTVMDSSNGTLPLELKFYKNQEACTVEEVFLYDAQGTNDTIFYTKNSLETITLALGSSAVITYPSTSSCFESGTILTPSITGNASLLFSGINTINQSTGAIDVNQISSPGVYNVVARDLDSNCVVNNSFKITIHNSLFHTASAFEITHPIGPALNGEINILPDTLATITFPAVFSLNNSTLTFNDSSQSGNFTGLAEGLYQVQVIDGNGCSASTGFNLSLVSQTPPDSNDVPDVFDFPVLLPGTPNGEVYISFSPGKTVIYNRSGTPVRTITTPGKWDGIDSSGNVVPIGYYFIIGEHGEKASITVIR